MLIAAHADVTEDGAVKSGTGDLVGVLLTAGSAAATLILYDNASEASGTVLASLKAGANTIASWTPVLPYPFANGCYADIGGTGAEATVVYL